MPIVKTATGAAFLIPNHEYSGPSGEPCGYEESTLEESLAQQAMYLTGCKDDEVMASEKESAEKVSKEVYAERQEKWQVLTQEETGDDIVMWEKYEAQKRASEEPGPGLSLIRDAYVDADSSDSEPEASESRKRPVVCEPEAREAPKRQMVQAAAPVAAAAAAVATTQNEGKAEKQEAKAHANYWAEICNDQIWCGICPNTLDGARMPLRACVYGCAPACSACMRDCSDCNRAICRMCVNNFYEGIHCKDCAVARRTAVRKEMHIRPAAASEPLTEADRLDAQEARIDLLRKRDASEAQIASGAAGSPSRADRVIRKALDREAGVAAPASPELF